MRSNMRRASSTVGKCGNKHLIQLSEINIISNSTLRYSLLFAAKIFVAHTYVSCVVCRVCRVSCSSCAGPSVASVATAAGLLSGHPAGQRSRGDIRRSHARQRRRLAQVTQLNHDVAPEVNVELVLSQVRTTAQPHTPQLSA